MLNSWGTCPKFWESKVSGVAYHKSRKEWVTVICSRFYSSILEKNTFICINNLESFTSNRDQLDFIYIGKND